MLLVNPAVSKSNWNSREKLSVHLSGLLGNIYHQASGDICRYVCMYVCMHVMYVMYIMYVMYVMYVCVYIYMFCCYDELGPLDHDSAGSFRR